ncbi:MAG: hypothetical protein CMI30_00245 [Opitutae bacterium]|nr:hypothetical protein [Opitutae bacterium]
MSFSFARVRKRNIRFFALFLAALPLGACFGPPVVEEKPTPPLVEPSRLGRPFSGPFPFVVAFPETVFYLTGPQQAKPPDGVFAKGMRVAIILDEGSYSLVTSETGVTAYVSTGSLRKIEPPK